MIIVIHTGRSFKGAAQYFLHDKRLPGEQVRNTNERLAWTHSFNTMEDDPDRVVREMQYVAYNQNFIRQQSGITTQTRGTEVTAMTVSLSWEPSQRPDKEKMIATARSFLDAMEWGEHQTLVFANNDTAHPHIHLLINRIHPTTGLTLNQGWDRTRASRWGLAYEREHGKVFCEVRELKYGRGLQVKGQDMPYGQWKMWRDLMREGAVDPEHAAALRSGEWATLKASQKTERLDFWKQNSDQRRQLRVAIRDEVKAEFKPEWHAYAKQCDAAKLEAAKFDRETRRAMRHYSRQGRLHGVSAVQQLKDRQDAYHTQMRQDLFLQRSAISERMKQRYAALAEPALEKHQQDRARMSKDLLAEQGSDRRQLHHDQAAHRRRPDLLTGYAANQNAAQMLSVEQIKSYKDHAIAVAAQRAQYAQARAELTPQAAVRQDNRSDAQRRDRTEQSDARREKTDKELRREQRDAVVRQYLADRKERERDRGSGGRER